MTFETDDDLNLGTEPRNDRETRRDERRDDRDDRRETRRDERRDEAPRSGAWSFDQIDAPSNRPRMGGVSDAALSALMDAFSKAKDFEDPGVPEEIRRKRFQLIPIEASLRDRAPALLVCLPTVVNGVRYTLAYVLLIEQEGPQQTRLMTDRGESYNALVLPEDQVDPKFIRTVKERLAGLGGELKLVGNQVILATTIRSITDQSSEHRISAIYNNAFDAICGFRADLVDLAGGNVDLSSRITPDSLPSRARLELALDYSGQQVEDSSGLPIRSDAVATMMFSRPSDSSDGYDRMSFAEMRFGLDLLVTEDAYLDSRDRRRRRDERAEPFWQAVMNINSITTLGNAPFNLGTVQLMLAQAGLFSSDGRAFTLLRPRPKSSTDPRPHVDLGALYLMHPDESQAVYVDDISPNMTDSDLLDYLDRVIVEDIAFGMTVPSSGEKSYVLSIFERIATMGASNKPLIRKLFDEADVLTDGCFYEVLEERKIHNDLQPVFSTGTRALLGYWDGGNGQRRDMREWNVQTVLTRLGAKHIDEVREFQDTFENNRRSVDQNLARRVEILSRIVPGLRITGTSEQLVLNKDYLDALGEALEKAKLLPYMTDNDGLSGRRRLGLGIYRNQATSDIGRSARREGGPRSRARRGIYGGDYYS